MTCHPTFQRATEDVFAADDESVSGDGRGSRCCTVGELLRDCDSVSVTAVQEKCDDKEQGVRFGLRVRRTLKAYGRCGNACRCERDILSVRWTVASWE